MDKATQGENLIRAYKVAVVKKDVTNASHLLTQYEALNLPPPVYGANGGMFQPATAEEHALAAKSAAAYKSGDNKSANAYAATLAGHVSARQIQQDPVASKVQAAMSGANAALFNVPRTVGTAINEGVDMLGGHNNMTFAQRMEAQNVQDQDLAKHNPISSTAGLIGTAGLEAAATRGAGAAPAAGGNMLATAGRLAATGALAGGSMGAAQGLAEGTGNAAYAHNATDAAARVVKATGKDAGIGAAVGGVLGPAAAGVAKTVSAVGGNIADRLAQNGGIRSLATQLKVPVQYLANLAANIQQRTGVMPSVAQLLDNATALKAGRLATFTDEGQAAARQGIATQQAKSAQGLSNEIQNVSGVTPVTKTAVNTARDAANAPAYAATKTTPVAVPMSHPAMQNPLVQHALSSADEGAGATIAAHNAALDARAAAPARIQAATVAQEAHSAAADLARIQAEGLTDRIASLQDSGGNPQRLAELQAIQRNLTAKSATSTERANAQTAALNQAQLDSQYNDNPTVNTSLESLGNVRENLAKSVYTQGGDVKNVLELPERKAAATLASDLITSHGDSAAQPASRAYQAALDLHRQAGQFNDAQDVGASLIKQPTQDNIQNAAAQATSQPAGVASGAIQQLQNVAGSGAQGASSTASDLAYSPATQQAVGAATSPQVAAGLAQTGQDFLNRDQSLRNIASRGAKDETGGLNEMANVGLHKATGGSMAAARGVFKVLAAARTPGTAAYTANALTDNGATGSVIQQLANKEGAAATGQAIAGTAGQTAGIAAAAAAPGAADNIGATSTSAATSATPVTPVPQVSDTAQNTTQPTDASGDDYSSAVSAREDPTGDPNAQPLNRDGTPMSSATGPYQFTDGTWLRSVKKYGADLGLTNAANSIDAKGNVSDPAVKAQILALRSNPDAAKAIFQRFSDDNAATLKTQLKSDPTQDQVYAAHVVGSLTASRLIKAAQGGDPTGVTIVGQTAAANNPSYFYDKQGNPLPASQVLNKMSLGN